MSYAIYYAYSSASVVMSRVDEWMNGAHTEWFSGDESLGKVKLLMN
jgi:hypothetical protein